jgi:hypothetical protein
LAVDPLRMIPVPPGMALIVLLPMVAITVGDVGTAIDGVVIGRLPDAAGLPGSVGFTVSEVGFGAAAGLVESGVEPGAVGSVEIGMDPGGDDGAVEDCGLPGDDGLATEGRLEAGGTTRLVLEACSGTAVAIALAES